MPLLHVLPRGSGARGEDASALTNSLGSLCKACRPEMLLCLRSSRSDGQRGAGDQGQEFWWPAAEGLERELRRLAVKGLERELRWPATEGLEEELRRPATGKKVATEGRGDRGQ
ncbi:hypothetical protein ZWY2020_025487 [Hordeum vulgare]|nr:hypothetical protein ZWY2020_025487 [Hordeum vulgare]